MTKLTYNQILTDENNLMYHPTCSVGIFLCFVNVF